MPVRGIARSRKGAGKPCGERTAGHRAVTDKARSPHGLRTREGVRSERASSQDGEEGEAPWRMPCRPS